jgi:ASC-1-like (ASCH) protein
MEFISERDGGSAEQAKINFNTGYEFVAVANHDSYYKSVKRAFKDTVEKLYGDQTTAIQKIKESEDRKCLVLVENGSPVAILVYKVKPTSEFSRYDIENSLEVKTFMLINPDSKDSEGHFVKLYSEVVDIAKQIHASGIHVTVSEKVTWTMSFLKKMGFKICRYWKDKYVQGGEYLLCKQVGETPVQKLPDRESETKRQRECRAERGSEFKKHEQDFGSKQQPEGQGQHNDGERSSGRDNESPSKRKFEGEHEFDPKRQRMDGNNFDKQQSSFHSHQGSHQKREERGETSSGRIFFNSDRESNFTPGNNMRQGERGESNTGRNSFNERIKQCTLKKQYIHMIQNGRKTVEGRINSGMFKSYKKDDLVRFFYQQDLQDDVTCKIEDAVPYKSFEEMLTAEGVGCCIPGIYKVSEGVRAYHQIPGYEQKAKQHGVVAFRLKVVRAGGPGGRR